MFSGIIQEQGTIINLEKKQDCFRLIVQTSVDFGKNLEAGASISIDGVCLTAICWELTAPKSQIMRITFEIIPETWERTCFHILNENKCEIGYLCNMERSLKLSDEIGGHFLSGHVHGIVKIVNVELRGLSRVIHLELKNELRDYVFDQGFIAINGASLTIQKVVDGAIVLGIIPETCKRTNLGTKQIDDFVNIEIDQMTRTIVDTTKKYISRRGD